MTDLDIRSDGDGSYVLAGALTFESVPEVLDQTHELFRNGMALALDLRDVTRTDSAGLALLVEWMREAGGRGCTVEYRHLPEQMLAIAHACRLDDLLPVQ